jgi:ATP-dependent RNA helicase DDX56/DBP9
MKRKLNEHDMPEGADTGPNEMTQSAQFSDLGLDARLLQAAVGEKYSKPTPVQVKAIPLALEGKDILGEYGFILANNSFH